MWLQGTANALGEQNSSKESAPDQSGAQYQAYSSGQNYGSQYTRQLNQEIQLQCRDIAHFRTELVPQPGSRDGTQGNDQPGSVEQPVVSVQFQFCQQGQEGHGKDVAQTSASV